MACKWTDNIVFNADGLIPVVAQQYNTKELLMMAWANAEAIEKTLKTGQMHYWSRSRAELWHKGATSGHIQHVKELLLDCDSDTLLALVDQTGAACHTGSRTCFFKCIQNDGSIKKIL